jgi:hypothetical protein
MFTSSMSDQDLFQARGQNLPILRTSLRSAYYTAFKPLQTSIAEHNTRCFEFQPQIMDNVVAKYLTDYQRCGCIRANYAANGDDAASAGFVTKTSAAALESS